MSITPMWWVKGSGKAFIDLQNDVTVKDVALAEQEGFRSVEHLKRYTTLGMATDQGKIGGVVGLAVLSELVMQPIPSGRHDHVPPALHARGARRSRRTSPRQGLPADAAAAVASMGRRAGCRNGRDRRVAACRILSTPGRNRLARSVSREVRTVRSAVGVCDVSTLGRIDVQGSDAGVFLDRVYTNAFSSLPVGKARYGLMLREDGFVMDDGTTSRIARDHYFMTTTTANAAKVMQHLEFCHQVLWPDLDVQMVSVSEQWAQYSIAGPHSRDTMRDWSTRSIILRMRAFPHLAAQPVTVVGRLNALLFSISFSGELAYELAVPARYGDTVIRAVMAAGKGFGIAPYGTETLGVMRIEKGHVSTNEINGQTTAHDLGIARMLSTRKDFIGRMMASALPCNRRSGQPRRFKPADRGATAARRRAFLRLAPGPWWTMIKAT